MTERERHYYGHTQCIYCGVSWWVRMDVNRRYLRCTSCAVKVYEAKVKAGEWAPVVVREGVRHNG